MGTIVAIIPNAKDFELPNERAESIDRWIAELGGWGFRSDVIDLREYEDPEILHSKLRDYPLVWVLGGNTFMLRSEMRRTGLDKFLKDLVENGMVYCGESAGAIVAGSTLEGTETADEPGLADEIILEGIGLIDKVIVPHADSADFVEYATSMRKKYGESMEVIYINDDQALAVNDGQQEIVTATG